MPASTEIELVQQTYRQWAARPSDAAHWMRAVELAPCPTPEPSECILRDPRELALGPSPKAAIRSLLHDIEPADWPAKVTARLFDFSGPAAVVDDPEAESALLSPDEASPLWNEIRDSASEQRVGLIHLAQLGRAIVPVLALKSSGAHLEVAPSCRESVYDPALAFISNN